MHGGGGEISCHARGRAAREPAGWGRVRARQRVGGSAPQAHSGDQQGSMMPTAQTAAKKPRAKKTVIVARGHELYHAEALGLAEMLAGVGFGVVEHEGTLHFRSWYLNQAYTWSGTARVASGAPSWSVHEPWCIQRLHRNQHGTPAKIPPGARVASLSEVVGSARCKECANYLSADPHVLEQSGGDPIGVRAGMKLVMLREEIARATDLPRKITPSALNTRQHRVRGARAMMERELSEALANSALQTAWSDALKRARGVLEDDLKACEEFLSKAFHSEDTSDAILAKIREELYGAGDAITVDETPTLVGLPAHCYVKGRIGDALLARYRLECKQGQVILVPRYIADWVLCSLHQGGPRAQTTAAPEDREQAILAAQMWDPTATGPMRSLRDMVTAAAEVLTT